MAEEHKKNGAHGPAMFLWLLVAAVLFFALTQVVVRFSEQRREALGEQWATRGRAEMGSGHPQMAIPHLRNALLYAPGDPAYRLSLAEAFLQAGRLDQAQAYLQNLWEDEPGQGRVNLDLARVAVQRQDVRGALRFYHGAIYGLWDDGGDAERRAARRELIDFLLEKNYPTLARSELIALEAEMPTDPDFQLQVASLYARAGDLEGALRAYERVLHLRPKDHAAQSGAGDAAFRLGRYGLAQEYLQLAAESAPGDTAAASKARVAGLLLHVDPYQAGLSESERAGRAFELFQDTGKLLQECNGPDTLQAQWTDMRKGLTAARIHDEPQLLAAVMQLVTTTAQAEQGTCAAEPELQQALAEITRPGRQSR